MKKMKTKENIRKGRMGEQGITLIALVVTIVVLLILAGITINMVLGDNGIFRTADEAEIEHRKGEIIDLLNTAEANVSLKALGKPSLEEYIEYIQEEEIVIEAEKEDDGSYLVTTEDGYVFSISIVEGTSVNDIVIGYEGQAGNLPSVVKVSKVTENSITVTVKRVEGASNISYGIRKVGEGSYNVVEPTTTKTSYEFTGLEEETEYEIEVRVTIGEEERVLTISKMTEKSWMIPETISEAIEQNAIFEETISVKDVYGNKVMVPKGFKVISDGKTVPEGIVIEDEEQNQFVWIPVGTIKKDETGSNISTIQLGRYTFADNSSENPGAPTAVQYAYVDGNANYTKSVWLNGYYREINSSVAGIVGGAAGKNTTAQSLRQFIESTEKNGGYYLARYEAVKIGTDSIRIKVGHPALENEIEGAKLARRLYDINDRTVGVRGDLVNSYAWDTAIVFIQEMGNPNYANQTSVNSELMNTGETGDKRCNIYDMASNRSEATTESSSQTNGHPIVKVPYPVTLRGGSYNSNSNTVATRRGVESKTTCAIRVVLWVKD